MGRKRAKEVEDILSVSIEHNWVVEKVKKYGKCLQKLSVGISCRKPCGKNSKVGIMRERFCLYMG